MPTSLLTKWSGVGDQVKLAKGEESSPEETNSIDAWRLSLLLDRTAATVQWMGVRCSGDSTDPPPLLPLSRPAPPGQRQIWLGLRSSR